MPVNITIATDSNDTIGKDYLCQGHSQCLCPFCLKRRAFKEYLKYAEVPLDYAEVPALTACSAGWRC